MLELLALGASAPRIVGVDLLAPRLRRAHRMLPAVSLSRANGGALPFRDSSFDLALQFTVFSSILDQDLRRRVAGELGRVLRGGGSLVWYDLRVDNPRNPDVRRIGRDELERLFPGWRLQAQSLTLAPPIARRLAPLSWLAAAIASRLPLLRTHLLARIIKPA
jgi:ubiquinone/menaquinone biosynthesis C-methylase UbiE